MAELSVEDLNRLARNFLVGRGGEAELEDMKRAMESDSQLALELLQQMQTALDDVAPPGFSPEQWKLVDARVFAVMAPLIRKGVSLGFLGRFFRRLFGSQGSSSPARIKKGRAPEEGAQVESPVSLASVEAAAPLASDDEIMEEMAPIAPASGEAAPRSETVFREELPETVEHSKTAPAAWILPFVVVIFLLLGAGAGIYYWMQRPKALPMRPAPMPPPKPKEVPTPSGPPERAEPPASTTETLPSELPPMTPQAAGETQALDGLDAKDKDGNSKLPLP